MMLVPGSLKRVALFHRDRDPNKIDDHKMPCIRIRLRATALPPMTEGVTWKSIRSFILENITAGQKRYFKKILVLDRPYDFSGADRLTIDGKEYNPALCSIRDWVIIQSRDSFTGKIAVFS